MKKPRVLTQWTEEEKSVLEQSFDFEKNADLPGFKEIRRVKNLNPCLSSRSEAQIKTQIFNIRKRKIASQYQKDDYIPQKRRRQK